MKIQISLSAPHIINRVVFDQVNGKGAIPFNQEIGYKGFVVMMKPSVFLSLARPISIGSAEAQGYEHLRDWIANGNPIGSPWLRIEVKREDRQWVSQGTYISGHEGRNRMLAIRELYGDVEIPVHITSSSMDNNKSMTPALKEEWRQGMKNEKGHFIAGPLWS